MAIYLTPICVDNLVNFFHAGIITPKELFPIGNYSVDALSIKSGIIPLYTNKVSDEGIVLSKEDDEYLKTAILKLKINDDIDFSEEDGFYLYRNCISLSQIEEIVFEDKQAKSDFERLTFEQGPSCFSFVDKSKIKQTGFSKLVEKSIKQDSEAANNDDLFNAKVESESICTEEVSVLYRQRVRDMSELPPQLMPKALAYAGTLCMAYVMTKNGELSQAYFHRLSQVPNGLEYISEPESLTDRIISFFQTRDKGEEVNENQSIYNDFFSCLIKMDVASNGSQNDVLNNVITFLSKDTGIPKINARFNNIMNEMRSVYDNTDDEGQSIKYALNESNSDLRKTLLSLVYNSSAMSMLENFDDALDEKDYLNFALFYGLTSQYRFIPKEVRNISGLEFFITQKIAQYIEYIRGPNSGKQVFSIKTILEMLSSSSLYLEKKQKIIKLLGISDACKLEIKVKDFSFCEGKVSADINSSLRITIDSEVYSSIMMKKTVLDTTLNKVLDICK
ncbi:MULTISPECIES: hypothetical protein [Shewanella]|uniref:Uncharacterized protein n=1 Tax=Shewanella marisflavi TaxID=260364 RepID=A0ABX5WNC7_9GAMM|nr:MULTISPECIES: hypothetical protein [Shewanella]QDF75260.1 hypothetical protein FGA12_08880 [Shewanella marisflavi]